MSGQLGDIKGIEERMNHLSNFVVGGFIVAVFGFIALIFTAGAVTNDYLAAKQASYLDLSTKVGTQNTTIESLTAEIKDLKTKDEMDRKAIQSLCRRFGASC